MPLKSFSMLQYAVLLFQFYISSGTECHGESQPCKCFIGKYECRNLSKQKCNWQSDISKCIDIDIDAEETTTDFPSYVPTDQPTPVPISSIHHTLNQETQQHEYREYQNGEQHHLYIPETKTTTTDFPSFQPTEDPTSNTESDYPIIECGDTINGHYQHKDIIFEIDLLYDTQSIEINACNSNYDTTLELFDGLDEDAPQYSDDNTCNNQYDSSLIEIENGLSAGTYYLLLSANNTQHHQHGNYEKHLFCQTESEIQHDKITSFTNKNNDTQTECNSNCDAFTIQMIYYGPLSYYNTDDIYYDYIDVHSDTNNRRLQTASETETKINPSISPTKSPSNNPSITPTKSPTRYPTTTPTYNPSNLPTITPTSNPSKSQSNPPTKSPSKYTTNYPSITPTNNPTNLPPISPTNLPTKSPTNMPTNNPSNRPTYGPSHDPTITHMYHQHIQQYHQHLILQCQTDWYPGTEISFYFCMLLKTYK